jgi:hypothetical protein
MESSRGWADGSGRLSYCLEVQIFLSTALIKTTGLWYTFFHRL